MRLNLEIIRSIMLSVEENLSINELGNIDPLFPDDIVEYPELKTYPKNEVIFYIKKLIEFNLLVKGKKYINSDCPTVIGITEKGYIFIDKINSNDKWSKFKSYLKKAGTFTFETFIQVAISSMINS
ncbi:DUF2513 domain-containing protein [Clostridium perfringens]|uniref:DUF2513 domain-containing protein n=1 Tax=Clostridium perfringens TaxID=1502 RepID=UPI001C862541|nr:DUF2513 domain-containing protein [Clostridium perfringens]EJT6169374.1 DUF2513 domain-containing protein [Clostridium perfringens]EJT6622446.1 DUF2513 domain-containing protein [Clostridium perfringens]